MFVNEVGSQLGLRESQFWKLLPASELVSFSESLWRAHGERIHVAGDVILHDAQCVRDVLAAVRLKVTHFPTLECVTL